MTFYKNMIFCVFFSSFIVGCYAKDKEQENIFNNDFVIEKKIGDRYVRYFVRWDKCKLSVRISDGESPMAHIYSSCNYSVDFFSKVLNTLLQNEDLINKLKKVTYVVYQGPYKFKHLDGLIKYANKSDLWPDDLNDFLKEDYPDGYSDALGRTCYRPLFVKMLIASKHIVPIQKVFLKYNFLLKNPEIRTLELCELISKEELVKMGWYRKEELNKKIYPFNSTYLGMFFSFIKKNNEINGGK